MGFPSLYVSMGVFAGFKPQRKASAEGAEEEIVSEAQLQNLIAQFSGSRPP
jgi:hypothetical protein